MRGNAVDLSVGVMMGAAFSLVVNALVKDLLAPLIGAIIQIPNFSGLFFTINNSRFAYGDLINAVFSFLLVSVAIYFFVVTPMNALLARRRKGAPPAPETKTCPECLSEIPLNAKRCAHCTQIILPNE